MREMIYPAGWICVLGLTCIVHIKYNVCAVMTNPSIVVPTGRHTPSLYRRWRWWSFFCRLKWWRVVVRRRGLGLGCSGQTGDTVP